MTTKIKTRSRKVLADVEKIICGSLAIMDEVEYGSSVYAWAEQIRELADKIEDWAHDPAVNQGAK